MVFKLHLTKLLCFLFKNMPYVIAVLYLDA